MKCRTKDEQMSDTQTKHKKTGIVLTLLLIALAAWIVYSFFFKEAAPSGMDRKMPPDSEIVYPVNVEVIDESIMIDYLKFNGDVVAAKSISIYPDISGVLTSLNVSLGDYVTEGEVIAQIDPSQPGQTYSVNQVTSTIDGTITDLSFDVGDTVTSTTVPVATVGDLKDLELECRISEKYMSAVALGQTAEITFISYDDITFSGTVVEISPVLDASSRTLVIRIALDENTGNIVKSGMFGSVRLITKIKENTISVPSTIVSSDDNGSFVYVVSDDNTAVRTYVETGIQVDDRIEILSGLEVGDSVIIRGQSMVQDGTVVNITED